VVPTAAKLEWIREAYAAGQREIEVGSFVPRAAAAAGRHRRTARLRQTLPGLRALGAGAEPEGRRARHRVRSAELMLLPLSASHAHSLANLRKTPDDVVAEIAASAPRATPPAPPR
jgi:hydroxymethylglutaryl-CoA lyase